MEENRTNFVKSKWKLSAVATPRVSVQIQMGHTIVYCTASVEERVPKWLHGSGEGWITAEYGMLPRSTHSRIQRDKAINSGAVRRFLG